MKRNFNIFLNVAMLALCVCAIAIGVYSAKQASLNVNGTVGFTAHDCEIKISGVMNAYQLDGTGNTTAVTKYFNSTNAVGGEPLILKEGLNDSWNIGEVCFDDLHTTKYKDVNDVEFTFNIENNSDFYVDVIVNQNCIDNDRIFIYAPNNGETLAPKTATEGKSIELIIKIQLEKDSSGEYSGLESALQISDSTPLISFSRTDAPAYLATDWKKQIASTFGIDDIATTTKLSFLRELTSDTLNGFDTNDDETIKQVQVGALNQTSSVSTYDGTTSQVYAYYDTDTKEIVIYTPARLYAPEDCKAMFSKWTAMTSVNLVNFDTSFVKSMFGTFNYCSSLTSIDLTNFDTNNVTLTRSMFQHCEKITELNLRNFNTSKVTEMNNMFYNCNSLTSIDLHNFDTSSVTNMQGMFNKCYLLVSLDLYNFDTSSVESMSGMFSYCSSLTSVNLTNFDTRNVNTMLTMFQFCESLTDLDLRNFDTSNVTDMRNMFYKCSSLTNIDLSNFDTSNVTLLNAMFYVCGNLETCILPNNLKFIGRNMFEDCSNLVSITIPDSVVWIGDFAFNHCSSLNLETITIPASVVQIGGSSYYGDISDTSQEYNNTLNNCGVVGTHVFYNCATKNLKKFVSLSENFVTDDAGALYTKDYKYLIAYPSANESTSWTMHSGCEDMFEMAFSRCIYLTDVTISDELTIYPTNVHTNFLNYANSMSLALYYYSSVRDLHVLPTNTKYIEEDGILYKAIDGNDNNLELVVIATSKGVTTDNIINISEKCTKISSIPMLVNGTSDLGYEPVAKFIVLNETCTITDAVITDGVITSGAGINENGVQYIYVDGASPYTKVEVQFGATA